MTTLKLSKKIVFSGKIELITGLHIGGTNSALNIGGPDKFVVRNPLNNIPYIPGSSLKGKLRALVEIAEGSAEQGKCSSNPLSEAGYLFGVATANSDNRASRIIVRDAIMDTSKPELFENCDLPFAESKTEVSIDRVTAKANPRTFERIPAGAKFNFEIIINIFEGEDENKLLDTFRRAIKLLEDDYLGGNGSRGYGQVKFHFDDDNGKQKYIEDYLS